MSRASSTGTGFFPDTSGNSCELQIISGYRDGAPVIVISSGVFGAVLSLENAAQLVAGVSEMMAVLLTAKEETEDNTSYS